MRGNTTDLGNVRTRQSLELLIEDLIQITDVASLLSVSSVANIKELAGFADASHTKLKDIESGGSYNGPISHESTANLHFMEMISDISRIPEDEQLKYKVALMMDGKYPLGSNELRERYLSAVMNYFEVMSRVLRGESDTTVKDLKAAEAEFTRLMHFSRDVNNQHYHLLSLYQLGRVQFALGNRPESLSTFVQLSGALPPDLGRKNGQGDRYERTLKPFISLYPATMFRHPNGILDDGEAGETAVHHARLIHGQCLDAVIALERNQLELSGISELPPEMQAIFSRSERHGESGIIVPDDYAPKVDPPSTGKRSPITIELPHNFRMLHVGNVGPNDEIEVVINKEPEDRRDKKAEGKDTGVKCGEGSEQTAPVYETHENKLKPRAEDREIKRDDILKARQARELLFLDAAEMSCYAGILSPESLREFDTLPDFIAQTREAVDDLVREWSDGILSDPYYRQGFRINRVVAESLVEIVNGTINHHVDLNHAFMLGGLDTDDHSSDPLAWNYHQAVLDYYHAVSMITRGNNAKKTQGIALLTELKTRFQHLFGTSMAMKSMHYRLFTYFQLARVNFSLGEKDDAQMYLESLRKGLRDLPQGSRYRILDAVAVRYLENLYRAGPDCNVDDGQAGNDVKFELLRVHYKTLNLAHALKLGREISSVDVDRLPAHFRPVCDINTFREQYAGIDFLSLTEKGRREAEERRRDGKDDEEPWEDENIENPDNSEEGPRITDEKSFKRISSYHNLIIFLLANTTQLADAASLLSVTNQDGVAELERLTELSIEKARALSAEMGFREIDHEYLRDTLDLNLKFVRALSGAVKGETVQGDALFEQFVQLVANEEGYHADPTRLTYFQGAVLSANILAKASKGERDGLKQGFVDIKNGYITLIKAYNAGDERVAPYYLPSLFALARVCFALGERKQAGNYFRRFKKEAPDEIKGLADPYLANLKKAGIDFRVNDAEAADALVREAVSAYEGCIRIVDEMRVGREIDTLNHQDLPSRIQKAFYILLGLEKKSSAEVIKDADYMDDVMAAFFETGEGLRYSGEITDELLAALNTGDMGSIRKMTAHMKRKLAEKGIDPTKARDETLLFEKMESDTGLSCELASLLSLSNKSGIATLMKAVKRDLEPVVAVCEEDYQHNEKTGIKYPRLQSDLQVHLAFAYTLLKVSNGGMELSNGLDQKIDFLLRDSEVRMDKLGYYFGKVRASYFSACADYFTGTAAILEGRIDEGKRLLASAKEKFRATIAKSKDYNILYHVQSIFNLGRVHLSLGETEEARKCFEEIKDYEFGRMHKLLPALVEVYQLHLRAADTALADKALVVDDPIFVRNYVLEQLEAASTIPSQDRYDAMVAGIRGMRQAASHPQTIYDILSDPIGRQVGQFTLVEKVGEGGSGAIFRARMANTELSDDDFRVKIYYPLDWPKTHPKIRDMRARRELINCIREECGNWRRFRHENIVAYNIHGQEGDVFWVAAEFVDGTDLESYMKQLKTKENRTLSSDEIGEIFLQVAEAVKYVHKFEGRGYILRDLSLSNILISANGTTKAKLNDLELMVSTSSKEKAPIYTKGSDRYAAPELRREKAEPASIQSDVYALGAMLLYMVTGETDTVLKLVKLGESEYNRAIKQFVNSRVKDIDDRKLILKAMAYHIKDRYQSVEDLLDDFPGGNGKPLLQMEPLRIIGHNISGAILGYGHEEI